MKEMNQSQDYVLIHKEDLEQFYQQAAKIGAESALNRLEVEKKKQISNDSKKKLHNTKLLLKNYRILKANANHSIYGKSQMEESATDILASMMNLYDDEVIVDAIRRSSTRTAIMIAHIDKMIEMYRDYCISSANELDIRRYEILYDMYIRETPIGVNEITEQRNISRESVYSDLKLAIKALSFLLFGIDSLLQK